MNFYFLLFDQCESLDLFGPVEIFGATENASMHYISMEGGLMTTFQGAQVLTKTIETLPEDSVLLVPGGMGTRKLVEDENYLEKLKALADSATYVLSVCTGSAVLAAAGLLNGVKATSNKRAFEWVKTIGPAIWIAKARWVRDGKYYTSSGVSAGIDMALGFVSDIFGRAAAEENAARAEYIWDDRAEDDPFAAS